MDTIEFDYYNFYKIIYQKLFPENKKIILEPISCIFRLILLIYMEEGTKISISNNSIQYNNPGLTQGLLRNMNGDGRDDLHNLYNPLLKSLEWYPPNNIDQENKRYTYFYQKCIQGIDILLKSYEKETIIHHTLQLYKKMLIDTLNAKDFEKIECKESPLLNNMKDFWMEEELEIIYKILLIINKYQDKEDKEDNKENIKVYLTIINNIITMKEKKVSNYIMKSSTTYN